jgi:hypothetical protein
LKTRDTTAPAIGDAAERQKRVRRSAIVLAIVAAGFYFGFIVLSLTRGHH